MGLCRTEAPCGGCRRSIPPRVITGAKISPQLTPPPRSPLAERIGAPRDGAGSCRTTLGFSGTNQALPNNSGPRWTSQGPQGESRPRKENVLYKMNQGPQDEPGPHKRNQGSAVQIRAPRSGSGSHGTNQGPAGRIRAIRDGSGRCRTNQGPRNRRAPRDEPRPRRTNAGPHGTHQSLRDEPGLPKTSQGFAGRIRAPQDETGPPRQSSAPRDEPDPVR